MSHIFSPLVEHAIELSAQWHDQTYRKSRWREEAFEVPPEELLRVPVMAHVTSVAMIVARAGWEDEVVAAAFLHDAIEDVNQYGEAFRRDQLDKLVGPEVTEIVVRVTEEKLDPTGKHRQWRDRKEGYIESVLSGSAASAAVSLADKLHNLWTINEALDRGMDVFTSAQGRRGLTAGPEEQLWFHRAVLEASRTHADPRLEPMRERLQEEIDRFSALAEMR